MDKRREELLKLSSYTEAIDNELTTILQSLQWDRKHLLQNPMMLACKYDSNHKVPPDKKEEHERDCFLRKNGYTKDDQLLPDPLDANSNTLVKLSKEDIEQIIGNAARSDPMFKKGVGCHGAEPLSLERLQSSYSSDERRVIYDAVVSAVPSCHDLTDLALPSGGDDQSSRVILSRTEILVQLRNMRRRRTKYRVAAKTRNYSDVLRDVIKTQMEHFGDGQSEAADKETVDERNNRTDTVSDSRNSRQLSKEKDRHRYERRGRDFHIPMIKVEVKTEREDSTDRSVDYSRKGSEKTYRYKEGRKEKDRDRERNRHDEQSREEIHVDRIYKHKEKSRKRRRDHDSRNDYNEKTRERAYEESEDRRKSHSDREYKSDKRSRRHEEIDLQYHIKEEPVSDDDRNHQERSREKRHEKYREKHRRTTEKKRKHRERSRERTYDHRYEEISSERIEYTQERKYSTTREYRSYYKESETSSRHRSKDRRHDRSQRDRSCASHSPEVKQERYGRYNETSPEVVYDPNKKIKKEK